MEGKRSPFSEIGQVGVVVKDIDKTIEYLSSLGIGPFEPAHRAPIVERKVWGKPVALELKVRFAQMGQVELELIQPCKGEGIQKKFLESKGEGIHHFGFFVDDLDQEVAKLVKQGVKVIQSGRRSTGGGFAYLETDTVGGIILELIQE